MSQRKRKDNYRYDGKESYLPRNKIVKEKLTPPVSQCKCKKKIRLQRRYIGVIDNAQMTDWLINYYNPEWHSAYKNYRNIKDAENAVVSLNSKGYRDNKFVFEYRLHPDDF